MSKPQDDATNLWGAQPETSEPQTSQPETSQPQTSQPATPVPPRDGEHDQTSASARAFAEGWPAQPGWVPEGGVGGAWGGTAPAQYQQQYPQQSAPPPGSFPPSDDHPTWVPNQSPYPPSSDPYAGGGYPPAAGTPYPGPNAPLPPSNSNTVVIVSILAAALLIAGIIGGVVFLKRNSGSTPTAATASGSTGGTAPNGTSSGGTGTTGGPTQNSTGGSGTSKSNGSGSGGSSTSTTPPMTSSTSIDLTTVHVPAYAASPDASDVAHTLDAYFTGINAGNYSTAWNQLNGTLQAKNPLSTFTANTLGTIDRDVTVTNVTAYGDGTARASVNFTSTQPGDKGVNPGETCTNWTITYKLQQGDGAGGWLISDTPSAQHPAC